MKVTSTITVEQTGIGKPDYSKEVSSSLERRGIRLAYGQTLKVFSLVFSKELSAYTWVVPPLAPGAIRHFIDNSTGSPSPLSMSKGYGITLVAAGEMVTEDAICHAYIDDYLIAILGVMTGGNPYYENFIFGPGTEALDPTGASSHTIDVTITNLGRGDLEGGLDLIAIVQAIGTPPYPVVKTVRCKFCGHEKVVPQETTRWICTVCGQLNIYYDLTRMKGTR